MKIVPHRRFTIDTRLTPLEVQARLRDAVEAPTFRLTKPERPFTGRVDGASFDVMRSIQGRNSFRPRVRGAIEAAGRGARLTGTMQVHVLVLAVMALVLSVLGSVFGSLILTDLRGGFLNPLLLAPMVPIVALPVAMVITFIREARRAFDEIGRIVDASHGELG